MCYKNPFNRLSIIFFCLIFFISINTSFSQDYSEITWYFGADGTGLQFNKNDFEAYTADNQHTPLGPGGSAMAVDPVTGDVLFYTDGVTIYDASGAQMPPNAILNGNNSLNRPAVICPKPGEPGVFYIFTNDLNGIYSSEVNMNLPGNANPGGQPNLGESQNHNTTQLPAPTNEAMIIIPGSDPETYYLVVQEATGDYNVFTITSSGITSPVKVPTSPAIQAANFSYNEATGRIAVSPQGANQNVQILNFDPTTGTLSFSEELAGTGNANSPAVYDTEWSEDGTKLYISTYGDAGNTGDVFQYDFSAAPPTYASVLPASVYRSYGLKMGPDNKIYHLYQETAGGPYLMGQINEPDSIATLVEYDPLPFGNTDFQGTQFPEIGASEPDCDLNPDFDVSNTCQNVPTIFTPTVDPPAQSYSWDFGNGSTSDQQTPTFIYEEPGSYEVTLTLTCGGEQMPPIVKSITINPNTLQEALDQAGIPQDTTLCPGETWAPDATTEGAISYRWSNGYTGPVMDPPIDSAGYYWVVVTDGSGCEAYTGVNVKYWREQNRIGNIWYFGTSAGIDFNKQPTEAIPGPPNLTAPEGVATMSDRNGDVLFYTDGETVWDRENNPMLNGDNIGGSLNSTQSSIIIPFPEDETLFYVFTTDELYGDGEFLMTYSIVDIKGNNGMGEVIIKDQPLFSRSTERVTAIEGGNGYILITHEYGNNTFRVYPIGPEGIGSPVLSSEGSIHSSGSAEAGEGYMKISPNGEKIAVALQDQNVVEVFDFVDSTLKVTNPIRLELEPGDVPYGIEFSPDGSLLFVTVNGPSGSKVLYYDMELTKEELEDPANRNEVSPNSFSSSTLGALQVGSDGMIYMAVNGSATIGQIVSSRSTDEDGVETISVSINPFDLNGGASTMGLPNFIQSIFEQTGPATASVTGTCLGDSTFFVGVPEYPDIDMPTWSVRLVSTGAQVFSSTDWETAHLFEEAGDYVVDLRVTNKCGYDTTITQDLTIFAPPDDPTLPLEPVSLCEGAETILNATPANDPTLTYLWSNGETGYSITVSTDDVPPGTMLPFSVVITNAEGCTSEGEAFVYNDTRPVDLGEDQVLCQDDAFLLDSQQSGAAVTWSVDGSVVHTGRRFNEDNLDTSVPGVYNVSVEVEDNLTGCISSDEVQITVNPVPVVSDPGMTQSTCGGSTGSLSFTATGSYTFQWYDEIGTDLGTNSSIVGQPSGIYTVEISDNGCTITRTYTITDNLAPSINLDNTDETCDGGTLTFTITGGTPPYQYRLVDIINTENNSSNYQPVGSIPFDVPVSEHSTYILEVIDDGGCKNFLENIEVIRPPDSVQTSIEDRYVDACIEAGGDYQISLLSPLDQNLYSFSWEKISGEGNFTTPTDEPSVSVDASGIFQVTVSDLSGQVCSSTEVFEVNLDEAPAVSIETVGDVCEGQITLRANPAPPGYSYQWSTGGTAPQITINSSQTVSLQVQPHNLNCALDPVSMDVVIEERLQMRLVASSACEGSPFTLTAESNVPGTTFTYFAPGNVELGTTTENEFTVGSEHPSGVYTVRGVTPNGCSSVANRLVSKVPFGEWIPLPEQATICVLDDDPEINSVTLDPGPGYSNYSWRRPDGTVLNNSQTISANQAGSYIVTITNSIGCSINDTTVINVDCEPKIFGPNAFSPNENNQNETFRLHTKYITEFDIKIFNRWGELIFQDNKTDFEWDGLYKGKTVQNGTYPYVVRYRSEYAPDSGVKEHRGSVTVVK